MMSGKSKKNILILMIRSMGWLVVSTLAILMLLNLMARYFSWWSASFRWPFFCFLLILNVFGLLIVNIHSWRRKRSLQELSHQLIVLASEKPETKITWETNSFPELQELIKAFNRVINHSQQLYQEELKVEKSKDEMMSNISHDLRTPLTTIIGYLGLVVNQNQTLSAEEQQKYIKTAYDKSNQMKVLVEDLFEFSKTQSQDVNLNLTQFSLGDLFAQLLASYELEAQQRGITLSYDISPKLIVMYGDSDKLARVFINLLNNAFKYADGATFIKLTAQIKERHMVEIHVANNGAAISSSAIKNLFDRFYRVDNSRNSSTGGSGLGLAIVKGIVAQHQGKIWVESDPDLTDFIIKMPLSQSEEESND